MRARIVPTTFARRTPGGARNGHPRHLYPRPHPQFPLPPQAPAINLLFANPPPSAPGVVSIPSPRGCEIMTSDLRGEIGVGGVSTPSGPVLPGTMGEPILHPGSGEASRVLPPEGLGDVGPTRQDPAPRRSPRAPQSRGWSKAVSVVNPGRVARLRSHFTPTTGSGSGASPCRRPAALLFDIAGRAGGRVRSPSILDRRSRNENPGSIVPGRQACRNCRLMSIACC